MAGFICFFPWFLSSISLIMFQATGNCRDPGNIGMAKEDTTG